MQQNERLSVPILDSFWSWNYTQIKNVVNSGHKITLWYVSLWPVWQAGMHIDILAWGIYVHHIISNARHRNNCSVQHVIMILKRYTTGFKVWYSSSFITQPICNVLMLVEQPRSYEWINQRNQLTQRENNAGNSFFVILYSINLVIYIFYLSCRYMLSLTHWDRDKMVTISQKALPYTFYWMKLLEFRLKLHWSLFLRVQITLFQHWFL